MLSFSSFFVLYIFFFLYPGGGGGRLAVLCLDELKTFFSAIDRDTCKDREGWLCKRAWCNFSERGYKRETTRYYLSLVREGIPVNSTALQRRLGFFLAVRLSDYCLAIEWYLLVGQLCVTLLCMGFLRLGG